MPIYEPSTRLVAQVAGRQLLRPDMPGQYTVTATITTASAGTTNVPQTIIASTYMGSQTCAACHSGGAIAEDKWHSWSQTEHAQIFSDEIDGLLGTTMKTSCLQCHTTGYRCQHQRDGWRIFLLGDPVWLDDPNGLDQWQLGGHAGESSRSRRPGQCPMRKLPRPGLQSRQSCSATPTAPAWPSISVNMTSGDCNQCHDDATHHAYGTEWLNSGHAVSPVQTSSSCVRCHNAQGFADFVDGKPAVSQDYMPINCQACHEPHGDTTPTNNPHMLRTMAGVTFQDGTTITNGGEGLLCMQCHQARVQASTYASNPANASSHFGPHHGPQGDMLEGVNGYDLRPGDSEFGSCQGRYQHLCHLPHADSAARLIRRCSSPAATPSTCRPPTAIWSRPASNATVRR